jgi:hypothetical protein
MSEENTISIIAKILVELENLIPIYMQNPMDEKIANGNVAVCIIDENGNVTGKMYGKNKVRSRETYKVAWTKASQVWLTGIKTGEYEKLVFNKLLKGNFIYFSSFVISRQALNFVENFKVEYKQAEDYELLLRLASKFNAVQTGHVYYRLHANNLSKIQTSELYIESLDILKNYLVFKEAKISFSYHFAKLGLSYFRNKECVNFIEFVRKKNYKFRYFFVGLGILLFLKFKVLLKRV